MKGNRGSTDGRRLIVWACIFGVVTICFFIAGFDWSLVTIPYHYFFGIGSLVIGVILAIISFSRLPNGDPRLDFRARFVLGYLVLGAMLFVIGVSVGGGRDLSSSPSTKFVESRYLSFDFEKSGDDCEPSKDNQEVIILSPGEFEKWVTQGRVGEPKVCIERAFMGLFRPIKLTFVARYNGETWLEERMLVFAEELIPNNLFASTKEIELHSDGRIKVTGYEEAEHPPGLPFVVLN